MARLFIAVDLPEETRERLRRLVPAEALEVRRVTKDQLHLTLHFIAEGEVDRIAPALAAVRAASFDLTLGKLGTFGRGNRPVVWWIGVERSAGLVRLHEVVGEALRVVSFDPEPRPFTPHITVARAKGGLPRREMERFLAQEVAPMPVMRVAEFHLYSSRMTDVRYEHVRERTYSLAPSQGGLE